MYTVDVCPGTASGTLSTHASSSSHKNSPGGIAGSTSPVERPRKYRFISRSMALKTDGKGARGRYSRPCAFR